MARHHEGGKESKINREAANVHKGSGDDRKNASGASKGKGSDVGNEKKADMKGAFDSNPGLKMALHHGVKELHAQHPIKHDDRGPHHHTDHHIRHKPMHKG